MPSSCGHYLSQLASPRGSRDKKTSDSLAVTSTVSQKNDANNRTQKFNEMHLADLQKVFEAETDEHGGTAILQDGLCDSCPGPGIWGVEGSHLASTFMSSVLFKSR